MSSTYLVLLNSLHHQISISEAHDLIERFDNERGNIISGQFVNNDPFTKSQTFEKSQILELLDQSECLALRAYFGLYDSSDEVPEERRGKLVLVLCGVDEDGNDLNLAPNTTASGQLILESAQMCPPVCSAPSLINNL